MRLFYELNWLWSLLGISLTSTAVCLAAALLICRLLHRRLKRKGMLLIAVAAFLLAVVAVFLYAGTAVPITTY